MKQEILQKVFVAILLLFAVLTFFYMILTLPPNYGQLP